MTQGQRHTLAALVFGCVAIVLGQYLESLEITVVWNIWVVASWITSVARMK